MIFRKNVRWNIFREILFNLNEPYTGRGGYNTETRCGYNIKIGAGMNFITPSTPKSTWCYNHPLLYVFNEINHSEVISSLRDRKILPKNCSSRLKN